jgi:LuxR family quorum-sensing system transcriptional regulator CciR
MGMDVMGQLARLAESVCGADDLRASMGELSAGLGFEFFALTHHVDILNAAPSAIRLHNYPQSWAEFYDRNALGLHDPVHRASQVTGVGFRWSHLPKLIPLTPADRRMLAMGSDQGIGDGFTVPVNIPGEAHGSCSFANVAGAPVNERRLAVAQLVGVFAFEGARRIWSARQPGGQAPQPVLTDRQRDCVLWAARGKSDWEISRILGVSEETVVQHVKQARERYGVQKRTLLVIRTLFDGTLSFDDVLKR